MKIIGVELKASTTSRDPKIEFTEYEAAELAMFGTQIEFPDDVNATFTVTLHTTNGDITMQSLRQRIAAAPKRGTLRELAARIWKAS